VSLQDSNDPTPEIHALSVAEMQRFRSGPPFAPPSLRGAFSGRVCAAALVAFTCPRQPNTGPLRTAEEAACRPPVCGRERGVSWKRFVSQAAAVIPRTP